MQIKHYINWDQVSIILTQDEVCSLLRISRSTIQKLRKENKIPCHYIDKDNRTSPRFCRDELKAWIEE